MRAKHGTESAAIESAVDLQSSRSPDAATFDPEDFAEDHEGLSADLTADLTANRALEHASAIRARAPERSSALPTLAAVIQHCEDGTCESHAGELASLKERLITATLTDRWAVREAAMAFGLIPKSIRVELIPSR